MSYFGKFWLKGPQAQVCVLGVNNLQRNFVVSLHFLRLPPIGFSVIKLKLLSEKPFTHVCLTKELALKQI